ncbi:MAG: sulfite exporter TauE/SafE family protein [Reichenbachiella sp.]
MYWSALILGFLGSIHCVVMCGPIALSMSNQSSFRKFIGTRVLYNFGRIITYSAMGLLIGLLGESIQFGSFQQTLSILAGVFMIFLGIALLTKLNLINTGGIFFKLNSWFRTKLGSMIKSGTNLSSIGLGISNGFLPCGLVYAALTGAAVTGKPITAISYMAVFGLGTFPAMLAVALSANVVKRFSGRYLNKFSSIFIMALGLLLILRGLNLDIPYLSPAIGFFYPLDGNITHCD